MLQAHLNLIGREQPSIDGEFSVLVRTELAEDAWLDYQAGWLRGDAQVFDTLLKTTRWHSEPQRMYDKLVETPRMFAALPADGPGHPVLEDMRRVLSHRYATSFERVSVALYRHGNDSVAWHGDRVARRMPEALVATVSVGAARRFLLRPHGGGRSIALSLGWGDLLVMGGSCQRTWQHAVPKVARAEPRIAIMFRPVWEAPTRSRAKSAATGY